MYTVFFGLQSYPFSMTPDPACLYLTGQHREAFAGLAYAILNRRGFAVLTGDAGTGKTTLLAKVLASLPGDRVRTSLIFHPTLSTDDFLELVLLDFGLKDIPASKAQRLVRLHSFLIEMHQQDRIATLIVDEAHKLSPNVLEEIRLLGNFDYLDRKLLQIVLIGQGELDEVLSRPDMRQLKQRIAVCMRIERLHEQDIASYIQYRWKKAGGGESLPFGEDTIKEIGRSCNGVPRLINGLCDNALLLAFADESKVVHLRHVRESAEALQLTAAPVVVLPDRLEIAANGNGSRVPADDSKASGLNGTHEPSLPVNATRPGQNVPSPIRVPDFSVIGQRRSLLNRLTGKLGFRNL